MAKSDYAIRMTTEGGGAVKAEFADVADAAERSADRQAKAYDRAAIVAARAEEKKEAVRRKAEEEFARLTGREAPAAAPSVPVPASQAGSAKGLDDILDQRRYQAAAQALRDAIDPAARAQSAYNAEVALSQQLLQRALISESEYAAAIERAEISLRRATGAEQEQQQAQAASARYQAGLQALLDKIEPARVAQRALNAELEQAKVYFDQGALSAEQYAAATRQAQQRHDIATGLIDPDAARKTAAELRQYEAAAVALRSQIDPLYAAEARFNQELETASQLLARGMITEREYASAVQVATTAIEEERLALARNGVSSGQQKFAMRDLGYQLQDLGTQFSMAAQSGEPFKMVLMAVSQQAPQVIQAIGMMKGEAAGFRGFLTGPWGMGVMAAVTVLGNLAYAHFSAGQAEDKHKDAAEDLRKAIEQLHEATEGQMRSTQASIQVDIDKANSLRQQAQEARKAAIAELELAQAKAKGAGASISPGAPGYSNAYNLGEQAKQEANARDLVTKIGELNAQIGASDETIRMKRGQIVQQQVREQYDAAAAAAGKYQRTLDGLNQSLAKGTISEDAYRAAVARAYQTQEAEEKAAHSREKSPRAKKEKTEKPFDSWGSFWDDYTAARKDVMQQLAQQAKADQAGIMAARVRDGEPAHASATDFSTRSLDHLRQMALIDAERSGDEARIRRQQLINELGQKNIDLTDDQIAQVLEWRKEEDEAARQADRHRQAWQQLREDGAQALDTLLNPDNITHWGDTFKQVLKQILFDLEKLALINPLENALFGGNRATLGGSSGGGGGLGGLLTGLVGSLFGKSSLTSSATATIAANPSLFADGTQSAPGGWAVVGERGKELVKLPRGAGVLTASRTRTALADSASGQPVQVNLTLDARGAGPREVEALQAQVDQLRREFPAIAVQAVANARQRRVIG